MLRIVFGGLRGDVESSTCSRAVATRALCGRHVVLALREMLHLNFVARADGGRDPAPVAAEPPDGRSEPVLLALRPHALAARRVGFFGRLALLNRGRLRREDRLSRRGAGGRLWTRARRRFQKRASRGAPPRAPPRPLSGSQSPRPATRRARGHATTPRGRPRRGATCLPRRRPIGDGLRALPQRLERFARMLHLAAVLPVRDLVIKGTRGRGREVKTLMVRVACAGVACDDDP